MLTKLFKEFELEFHELLTCGVYVYMWKGHPLAGKEEIALEELDAYPCLSFEQGVSNSFYFAEEVLSTYAYKRLIKANDRATLLNLMVGLKSDEVMAIGYLKRKGAALSPLGQKYLEEIGKFRESVL